jgi:hypothetical protein
MNRKNRSKPNFLVFTSATMTIQEAKIFFDTARFQIPARQQAKRTPTRSPAPRTICVAHWHWHWHFTRAANTAPDHHRAGGTPPWLLSSLSASAPSRSRPRPPPPPGRRQDGGSTAPRAYAHARPAMPPQRLLPRACAAVARGAVRGGGDVPGRRRSGGSSRGRRGPTPPRSASSCSPWASPSGSTTSARSSATGPSPYVALQTAPPPPAQIRQKTPVFLRWTCFLSTSSRL